MERVKIKKVEDATFILPASDDNVLVFIISKTGADWFFANYYLSSQEWEVYDFAGDIEESTIELWCYLPQVNINLIGYENK